MTYDVPPPRRPIGAVRISTVALLGVVMAVSVPAVAAAIVLSDRVPDLHATVPIEQTGPITRVVVDDSESSVTITGDASAQSATGQAEVQWKGEHGPRPTLRQSVADGVLTLSKECVPGGCGSIDITLRVPAGVSVRAATSNGSIQVTDIAGGVDLKSSNGELEAHGLGAAPAVFQTTNGAVSASFTGAAPTIRVQTSNGDVHLVTDGRTAYWNSISTTHGSQDIENVRDRLSANEISVSTTNGNVSVK